MIKLFQVIWTFKSLSNNYLAINIDSADDTFGSLDDEQFQQIFGENDAQARAEEIRQLQSELENPSRGGTPDTIIDACLDEYLLGETLDETLAMGLITRDTAAFIDETAEMMEDEEDPPATVTPEKTFTEL